MKLKVAASLNGYTRFWGGRGAEPELNVSTELCKFSCLPAVPFSQSRQVK